MDLEQHQIETKKLRKENEKFFRRLKRVKPKVLDKHIHPLHEAVFACADCLQCANCCSTTSPLFTHKDISRIAKHFRMKPSAFTEQYLQVDEDNDYVLKSTPCTFLGEDKECTIYDVRPKACKEYPHTDRIKQHQLLSITQKNVEVCPAVQQIIERLKKVVQ